MSEIDISEELADLLKVYTEAEEHLEGREQSELALLCSYMNRFLKAQSERIEVTEKLRNLQAKLNPTVCNECCCNEEEEE